MLTPVEYYNNLISTGVIKNDLKQRVVLDKLQNLHKQISGYRPRLNNLLNNIFSKLFKNTEPPKGIYIYGSVGTGKSVLLKSFYETVHTNKKIYMHFHIFLLELNTRLVKYNENKTKNAIDYVAKDLLKQSWLFCFDECVVSDVGDAMLFGRVAEIIIKHGGVIVCTSNFPSDKLKPRGVGNDVFKPYVDFFFENTLPHNIDSDIDYRRNADSDSWAYYLYPLNDGTRGKLQRLVDDYSNGEKMHSRTIPVRGHNLKIRHSGGGVACTVYEDLMISPYGVEDFIILANDYHTVVMGGMKSIDPTDTAIAKRFIVLVDILYEARVRLILSADCPPEELYSSGVVSFEFNRAMSRLREMQSLSYINKK